MHGVLPDGSREQAVLRAGRTDPLHYRRIRPKTVRTAAEESQVSAALARNQLDRGIRAHRIALEDLERNEGIVLGLDEQRGGADGSQVTDRRLGPVIIGRVAETEGGRGDLVVDREDGAQPLEIAAGEPARGAHPLSHTPDEALFVQAILRPPDL